MGAGWAAMWGSFPLPQSSPVSMAQAKGSPESSFNDENLRMVISDLFAAGMVSTSTTLTWALLLMILHPDVQHEPTVGPGGMDEGGEGQVGAP